MLKLEKIVRRFGNVTVLDGVDLAVEPGEIHALVGENGAGKSTLMKVLCGALSPSGGTIRWQGNPVQFATPRDARTCGIAMIHQELALVPELSVAENICLGEPRPWWQPIHFAHLENTASAVLARLGQSLDPRTPVRTLSLPQQQFVETARALFQEAKLLILDEPTAALGAQQTEQLFAVLRRIQAGGTAIIYISHRLEEIFALCDQITILRNGRRVHSGSVKSLTMGEVVHHMVGKSVSEQCPTPTTNGAEILRVQGLETHSLKTIDFSLRSGEILGIVGLAGSGRSRLLRTLFGANPSTSGTIQLAGKVISPRSPKEAIALGIGLLGEDRKRQGIIPLRTVRENMALGSLDQRRRFGVVHARLEKQGCEDLGKEIRLQSGCQEMAISHLSGGNQQKVLLGRWLLRGCKVLLLDEPTRGVDIEAKSEIYQLICRLATSGTGVIVVSSDLSELTQLCERLLVLRNGKFVAEALPPYNSPALLAQALGVL
ncbi:MAG: sugar ABC transporter ATP-binding protein [Anaerolineae bacterium]|nr:sugar ABC transporter ATP-binding protein [Gloeobacterales cyanobacterium ES-bin-313]